MVSTSYLKSFSKCVNSFGYTIEDDGHCRTGLVVRALLASFYYSTNNSFSATAVSLYANLVNLHPYSTSWELVNFLFKSLPESFILGFNIYEKYKWWWRTKFSILRGILNFKVFASSASWYERESEGNESRMESPNAEFISHCIVIEYNCT